MSQHGLAENASVDVVGELSDSKVVRWKQKHPRQVSYCYFNCYWV